MAILVFGDSITYGAWDAEGGWADRLKRTVHKKVIDSNFEYYQTVVNLGIPGDTSHGVVHRFDHESSLRDATAFIFAIGVNDSVYEGSLENTKIPLAEFKENIELLIQKARVYSDKIVFIGPTPVDDFKMQPIPWCNGIESCSNESIQNFTTVLKDVSTRDDISFLNMSNILTSDDLLDGIHPTTHGHQKMYDAILPFLESGEFLKSTHESLDIK